MSAEIDIVERLEAITRFYENQAAGSLLGLNCYAIRAELAREAAAEIVRLRGEVAERADDLTTAYMAGRFDGKAIAPAEAKGDACNCPGGNALGAARVTKAMVNRAMDADAEEYGASIPQSRVRRILEAALRPSAGEGKGVDRG